MPRGRAGQICRGGEISPWPGHAPAKARPKTARTPCNRVSRRARVANAARRPDRPRPLTLAPDPGARRSWHASAPLRARFAPSPGAPMKTARSVCSGPSLCSVMCLVRRRVYSRIFETTPAPTVRPPSRMAKRSFSSIAIGLISSTTTSTLSPGMTISVPSFKVTMPVTSVVRK